MKYRLLLIKRVTEDIVMYPLILLGRLIAFARPMRKEYDVFYFFPFYHTGGAEKIHALIAQTTATKNGIIFFTRKSHNATFLSHFQASGGEIKDIANYTDNKWLYVVNIIFRGIISGYINRQAKCPVVFNGQCNFAYKISPWIKKGVRQVELIHSLNSFSYIRIPFLPFYSATAMISKNKISEHLQLYKRFGIPERLSQKIQYIPNASDFEDSYIEEKDFSTVRVLYSGRATPEKRTHLIAAIAERVHQKDPSVGFVMAGDDFENLDKQKLSFVDFKGNISDKKSLQALYRHCNVLLITSSTEGFPLAVIEGMAYGCAVLATPVGDLPVHVKQGENGFLFSSVENGQVIVEEAVRFILHLQENKNLHKTICANNTTYAKQHFGLERFRQAYKKLIFS